MRKQEQKAVILINNVIIGKIRKEIAADEYSDGDGKDEPGNQAG